jgi:hypothetical protein
VQFCLQVGDTALLARLATPGTRGGGYGLVAGRKMPTRTRPPGTPTRVPRGFAKPLSNTSHITHVSELKARHWQDIDSQLDSNFDVNHPSDGDKATTMKEVINAASRCRVVLSSDEDE